MNKFRTAKLKETKTRTVKANQSFRTVKVN